MKTAIDQQEAQFLPINIRFLDVASMDLYDIYYKTSAFGQTRFVKFASSHPSHHEKVLKVIESEDSNDEFFILEEDVVKYHKQVTKSLHAMVANPLIPLDEKTQKIYDVSKGVMKDFFENNASAKILESSEEVMSIMEKCLSENDGGFHSLSIITCKDYYTYTHSVNVGLYCLAYGLMTKMGPNDTRDLGLGGILHDVGKSKMDVNLINKKGKLTKNEFEIIKTHAPIGKEILEAMQCYRPNIIRMAGEHHERYRGKGYPKGLVKKEISYFARICKVMDVYDALITRRSYKKALAPYDAINVMAKQMADEFDLEIFTNFVRFLGPEL